MVCAGVNSSESPWLPAVCREIEGDGSQPPLVDLSELLSGSRIVRVPEVELRGR